MGSAVKVQPPGDRKEVIFYEKTHFLSVQDSGKTGAKTGIKLAYKRASINNFAEFVLQEVLIHRISF